MVEIVVGFIVAVVVLLVLGDLVFKRVYSVPEPADEEHTVETDDGIGIALYRHKPKLGDGGDAAEGEDVDDGKEERDGDGTGNGEPVLLVHGLSVSHRNMNFDDVNGVAQYLAEHGYDCWCVDLRGRGGSDVPGSPWSFDDYAEYDIPAAVDYVREQTGDDAVHWVGHSQGGMLFYAFAGARGGDDAIRSAVTLGSPVHFYEQPFLGYISRFGVALSPVLSRIKRLHTVPYTARVASALLPLWPNFVVVWLANKPNSDYRTYRHASTCVVARLCPSILVDFARWITEEEWTANDGTDYHEGTRRIETPTLVVAGDKDTLCPRRNIKPGYRMLASDDKEYIVVGDDIETEAGYAHADLVFGKNAPEEVFPHITDWLDSH